MGEDSQEPDDPKRPSPRGWGVTPLDVLSSAVDATDAVSYLLFGLLRTFGLVLSWMMSLVD